MEDKNSILLTTVMGVRFTQPIAEIHNIRPLKDIHEFKLKYERTSDIHETGGTRLDVEEGRDYIDVKESFESLCTFFKVIEIPSDS